MSQGQPEYLDETHQRIAEFAGEFLEEDEVDDFVDGLLERRGYTKAAVWAPPAPQQGGQGGGKPLLKARQQQQRGGQQQQRGGYFRGSK